MSPPTPQRGGGEAKREHITGYPPVADRQYVAAGAMIQLCLCLPQSAVMLHSPACIAAPLPLRNWQRHNCVLTAAVFSIAAPCRPSSLAALLHHLCSRAACRSAIRLFLSFQSNTHPCIEYTVYNLPGGDKNRDTTARRGCYRAPPVQNPAGFTPPSLVVVQGTGRICCASLALSLPWETPLGFSTLALVARLLA